MNRLANLLCCIALAASLPATLAGCGKDKSASVQEAIAADRAVTERNGDAQITWSVSADGDIVAQVKDKDDVLVTKDVTGSVTLKPGGKVIPLAFQADTGTLTGKIPKLTDDLTEVAYDLKVGGKTVSGAMHLPRGGTKELVDSGNEAAAAKTLVEGKKGPNGGVVQVVGDDIVEVVGDKGSGDVRMYFLDDDLKVIPIGKRKGKVAFVGPSSVTVDMAPGPTGLYLTGKATPGFTPAKITVVVIDGDEVDVALCGYYPGTVIVVGPGAPILAVFVVTGWPVVVVPGVAVPVIIHHKGKGKGKWKKKYW